jgi:hypothetical protein
MAKKKQTSSGIDLEGLLTNLSEQVGELPLGRQIGLARSMIEFYAKDSKKRLEIPKEIPSTVYRHCESIGNLTYAAKFADEIGDHKTASRFYKKKGDFFEAALSARRARDIDETVKCYMLYSSKDYSKGESGLQALSFAWSEAKKAKRQDLVEKVCKRALKRCLNSERWVRKKRSRKTESDFIDAKSFESAGFYASELGMAKEAAEYNKSAIELYVKTRCHIAAYDLARVAKFEDLAKKLKPAADKMHRWNMNNSFP